MAEISQVKLPSGQIYDIIDSGAARIGDITTIQSNVSALQSNMSTAQSNISTLQSNMSAAQTNITNLQNKFPISQIIDAGGNVTVTAQSRNVVITTMNDSGGKQNFTFSTGAITLWTYKVSPVVDSLGGGIAFIKS